MEVPQKIKNRTTILSTSDIYPKEMKTGYQKYSCIPMFIAALFIIVKIWK